MQPPVILRVRKERHVSTSALNVKVLEILTNANPAVGPGRGSSALLEGGHELDEQGLRR